MNQQKPFVPNIKKGSEKRAPRIVLVGVEGVGKSTAGSACPSPIFLTPEDGLIGTTFNETPNFSPKTWTDAVQFIDWLTETEHEYKSLIIDTLDWLEPRLFSFLCNRDNKASIEDYGYGKGYIVACDEYRTFLARLERLHRAKNMLIMVTSHCHIKNFSNPAGDNFDRYEMKVSKQIAGLTKEWADVVLFARFDIYAYKETQKSKAKGVGGQKRIVHTSHSAAWDAKNRFNLPSEMPLDMATILSAVETGSPDEPEKIIAEIKELSSDMPKDKQKGINDYIKKYSADSTALAQLLNRVRVQTDNE